MSINSRIKNLRERVKAVAPGDGRCTCGNFKLTAESPETYKPERCHRCGGYILAIFVDETDLKA